MIELGRGAVNMVHKVVGTGSSYLAPHPFVCFGTNLNEFAGGIA